MAIGRKRVMKKSQELNNKKRNDAALLDEIDQHGRQYYPIFME